MSYRRARRMDRMRVSTIREILKITKQKDVISFAGGLPAPELFPIKEFAAATAEAFRVDGASALQYDVTEGYPPLKEYLCRWLGTLGIHCRPENMMLTNGSQQALDLIGKVFIDPKSEVLVEDPTYLGALQAFNAYEPRYVTVPLDNEGMRIPELRNALQNHQPRLAYLVPTFQNPSGITMTRERRTAFLKQAAARKMLVVEDDPYGYLRFSGKPVPSLYHLARGRGVLYVSTFSKILSPGIRVGFVVGEKDLIQSLVLAKQAADLQPNSLIQRAAYHYARRGHFERHIPIIIKAYKHRARVMLEAIQEYFPREIECVEPEGGMFIWCRLPPGLSASKLFLEAVKQKVAYVTGEVFYANGGGEQSLRLNFTNSSDQQICEGIRRLAQVFTHALR